MKPPSQHFGRHTPGLLDRFHGPHHSGAGQSAVVQQEQPRRRRGGIRHAQLSQIADPPADQPVTVMFDHDVHGMVGPRELGDRIRIQAAPEVAVRSRGSVQVEDQENSPGWIRLLCREALQCCRIPRMAGLHICRHQRILRTVRLIQARSGSACLAQDAVNANRPDALSGEQLSGCPQKSFSGQLIMSRASHDVIVKLVDRLVYLFAIVAVRQSDPRLTEVQQPPEHNPMRVHHLAQH